MADYSCKRSPSTFYPLATVHLLQTDGQTNRRWTTTMPIALPLHKYGRLKRYRTERENDRERERSADVLSHTVCSSAILQAMTKRRHN